MSTERRFLVRALGEVGTLVELDEQALHHLRVLRVPLGATITLFDGIGGRAAATVVHAGVGVRARIDELLGPAAARPRLVLVQCLPKGGKMDDIVRGATELGVDEIRIATSDHTLGKLDDRWDRKQARFMRIAEEASRQAERDDVPSILAPAGVLEHAAAAPSNAIRLTLCGRSGKRPSPHLRADSWLVVGPEGGLSERELAALDALAYTRTSIATTILRVETAAIAALAVARHLAGNDGDR